MCGCGSNVCQACPDLDNILCWFLYFLWLQLVLIWGGDTLLSFPALQGATDLVLLPLLFYIHKLLARLSNGMGWGTNNMLMIPSFISLSSASEVVILVLSWFQRLWGFGRRTTGFNSTQASPELVWVLRPPGSGDFPCLVVDDVALSQREPLCNWGVLLDIWFLFKEQNSCS